VCVCVCVAGLLCDLLWSDPDKDVQGWGENDRGVSFTFGADVVSKFLNRHDLDLICRAHQVTKLLSVSGIHSRVTFFTHTLYTKLFFINLKHPQCSQSYDIRHDGRCRCCVLRV